LALKAEVSAMSNKTLASILWLLLAANVIGASALAKDRDADPPNLRVSVFNDANITERKLLRVETVASRVFARSGVVVEWLNCGRQNETKEEEADCAEASLRHLQIRILFKSLNLKQSAFGISYLDGDGTGCYADVFYGGLADVEEAGRPGSATFLGVVMAHELGHLLLGINAHSSTGIMRPVWNDDDLVAASKGNLYFTEAEGQILRARLESGFTIVPKKQPTKTGFPSS
jgi:hypothetical protein